MLEARLDAAEELTLPAEDTDEPALLPTLPELALPDDPLPPEPALALLDCPAPQLFATHC